MASSIHNNNTIQVNNLMCGSIVSYSLPLLVGEVKPAVTQGSISASTVTRGTASPPLSWPVCNGCFKILVHLEPGENRVVLCFNEQSLELSLHFQVPHRQHFVRPVLIKCCDEEGSIQGPAEEDLSPHSACRRISLGARILQTFTAEKMQEHGFGRKTFALEHDLDPSQPECHVFTSRLTMQEAHSMTGGDMWLHFAKELMASKQLKKKEFCKWFAFMSFTRYEAPADRIPKSHSDILKNTKGHTALGGGGLALFGSGNMHTWAQCLEEVVPRFTDMRKIDRTVLMDDSAYREYYWANYSTGLGASLHELGHTFDLAHTPTGVMARGFDDLYRVFMVHPLSSATNGDNHRVASPVPYSPRQSPIHRPQMRSKSRSSSPKACPLSRPRLPSPCPASKTHSAPYSSSFPSIVLIEPAFQKLHIHTSQTMVLHNYDGSETRRTITRHRDGVETVSEVTSYMNGGKMMKEVIRHLATGKSRTTMSMSTSQDTGHGPLDPAVSYSSCSSRSSSGSRSSQGAYPSSLPQSPEEDAGSRGSQNGTGWGSSDAGFQEMRYKDGGAHWYRSSAVLLFYHKWFNASNPDDPRKTPVLDGCELRCSVGLRLVELRSVPEGVVLHHWEFLHQAPPTRFKLRYSEVLQFCSPGAREVGVLAEEGFGNIFKKKILLSALRDAETGAPNGDVRPTGPIKE